MKRILLLSIITLAFSNLQAQTKQELSKFNKQSKQYGFIENKGQIYDQNYIANPTVKYILSLGNGLNVQLKSNSFSYDTYKTEVKERKKDSLQDFMHPKEQIEQDVTFYFHRVDVELLGAKENPIIITEEPSADYLNYYNAVTPEEGATMVRSYKKVTYKNIYNGIDLEFVAQASKAKPVEYNFIVHPGADAKQIQLKYHGANQTNLKEEEINIEVAHGTMSESIPASWLQESKQILNITYKCLAANTYGFNIPNYNPSQTLIIDPNPDLVWATYFGGFERDDCYGVNIDSENNLVVVGSSISTNSIATNGTHQSIYDAYQDAYVVKFDVSGIRQWGTYYGGNYTDYGYSIACDKYNNIYMTGTTMSTTGISTSGAYQTTFAGGFEDDAFITKLNTNGLRYWGTYFGGTGRELVLSIACNLFCEVSIIGATYSAAGISTPGAFKPSISPGGQIDVFVSKFTTDGNILWSTYYGGNGQDWGYDLCFDKTGNLYITGWTESNSGISTPGAYQISGRGFVDAFIAKMSPNGARIWGTYYGGSSDDGLFG